MFPSFLLVSMGIYDQIVVKIIKEQESIMGPIAWNEATKVEGIRVIDKSSFTVEIEKKNGNVIVDNLVHRFEKLFGRTAREVCKDAVSALVADLKPSEIPSSLQ